MNDDTVAIIGLACRFPGAADADEFWRNLVAGREGITVRTREELAALGVPAERLDDQRFVPAGGVLDGLDRFDAAYFGIPPRDAHLMDPQHRVFLECAVAALEDAGQVPGRLRGDVGVYAAAGFNSYLVHEVLPHADELTDRGDVQWLASSDKDYLATRAAYLLGLTGPAMSVQSACSSALVALHLAAEAVLSGECELALAGAVSAGVFQGLGYTYSDGGILSPDGHCRPFDVAASGTVFGSGVGAVVLKRLADALADGDTVRAVVLGSAINNDGGRKVGFTAPSAAGQARVIAAAQSVAGVGPAQVSYLEAHGTATPLGDEIELAALRQVFADAPNPMRVLGSVKSNVGHLDTCAGMAGLIKTVLCLQHRTLVGMPGVRQPRPTVGEASFRVLTEATEWPGPDGTRVAGVSAFGVGGTNAHVVLGDSPSAPPEGRRSGGSGWQVLPLSARTPAALDRLTDRMRGALQAPKSPALGDVAFTLQVGRRSHPWRRPVLVRAGDGRWDATAIRGDAPPEVAFSFAGQGHGHPGLAADLYQDEPLFRDAVERCLEALRPWTDAPLRKLLLDPGHAGGFDRTEQAQPALFTLEYALACWWTALGVRPVALVGHSIGEFAAACLAGIFTLPDAARLVAERGRLTATLPPGAMLAVPLSEAAVREFLDTSGAMSDGIDLAAVNAPDRCVLAGAPADVHGLAEQLAGRGVATRRLATRHAFHSRHVDLITDRFAELVAGVATGPATVPVISTVTGRLLSDAEAASPSYWAAQLRRTVRYSDALAAIEADALVEIGPARSLPGRARGGRSDLSLLASLDPPTADGPPARYSSLARLWQRGVEVEWTALGDRSGRRRVSLPTYPFEPTRHWFRPTREPRPGRAPVVPAYSSGDAVPGWLHVVDWAPTPPAGPGALPERVLVLLDTGRSDRPALGPHVVDLLRRLDVSVLTVEPHAPVMDSQWCAVLLARFVARGETPDAVIDCRAAGFASLPVAGDPAVAEVAGEALNAVGGLLSLHRAIAEVLPGRPVRTVVATESAHGIGGQPPRTPQAATVLGAVRVVPLESPNLRLAAVDLDLADRTPRTLARAAEALLAELRGGADPLVAVRGRRRLVPRASRPSLATGQTGAGDAAGTVPVIPAGGVHVITGGLGGMGLALAEQLATQPGRTLLLLTRGPVPDGPAWHTVRPPGAVPASCPPELASRLARFAAAGTVVCLVQADVTDAAELSAALDVARARFGRIAGVVHAAGVPDGVVIARRTDDQLARVLAPKVTGTLLLHLLTAADQPDYVVLCSSVLATTGAVGQAAYTAANAFLDSFAHLGERTVAIGWDRWSQTGMAVRHGAQGARLEHPLFASRQPTAGGGFDLLVRWGRHTRWLAGEHRLRDESVLPGTALLELALAGHRLLHGPAPVYLDAVFAGPLPVSDTEDPAIVLRLRPAADGAYDWEIAGERVAASGRIGPYRGEETVEPAVDVAALSPSLRSVEDAGTGGSGVDAVQTGPRWRCLTGRWQGEREALLRLELPNEFGDDLEAHPLHPALFDVATGAAAAGQADYLPAAYRRIVVYRDLPAAGYARVVRHEDTGDSVVADVTFTDPDGLVAVEVKGFVLRPAPSHGRVPVPGRDHPAGREGIGTAEGRRAFDIVLANRHLPHILVTPRLSAAENTGADLSGAEVSGVAAVDRPGIDVSDAGALERAIAQVWVRLLGVPQAGPDDSIFELGGDSLLIVQIAAELQKIGIAVSPGDIFAAPTVARLAAHVRASRPPAADLPRPDAVVPDGEDTEARAAARGDFPDTDLDPSDVARVLALFDARGEEQ
ncbi:type I polyketide synthase [Plantactinospora soyae]|uniref:Acyl transferase domain-containing protein n=1 Tax=Plantactinospora soyae TaxID=1544732 RepID=A0A927M2B1_9ACTN|nr:type I polyketide synthase [Plantactinospora soyae]MBE1485547.1 acyl transferase domain-containing protein [Plantactinospora soyae]